MVARDQQHRDRAGAQGLEGPKEDRAVELIRLEHVTADHHETGAAPRSDPADLAHGVEPGLVETRAGVVVQEMGGHSQLPVCGCDEPHRFSLRRISGISAATVGRS